jgi:hypothetical protein
MINHAEDAFRPWKKWATLQQAAAFENRIRAGSLSLLHYYSE